MHRLLIAHTPLGDDWWAVSLDGTEALSTQYAFQLELKSKNPDIDGQALIGEVASVELEAQDGIKRYFSGQIVKVSARGLHDRHWAYGVTLAPKLWHASRRADFKIWQNRTVREIADEVLSSNAMRYEWRLKNSYKTWEYLVQYNESDLNFLSRLFEHEGIYYWFDHGEQGETLVLGDHFSTHEPFGGYERIPFYPPDQARSDEDHYSGWSAEREPESGRYTHSDYDFKSPSKNLTTEFSDPRGHLFDQYEVFAYPGNYTETADGSAYAAARLEALQSAQDVLTLKGDVRGAIPGARFTLHKHPRRDQNRDLTITAAHYHIINNDYESGSGGEGAQFQVEIEAIPADRQFRPPLKTPKPHTRGPDTAVVVGPGEIHTDEYGRVKVHFHWDRYGARDGSDSCWIRVAYPGAGSNFGEVHIPRVGQEVIVDFEHGDPDRPIITGRVYNAAQMPPWDLPASKTQSGILTRSTPGGAVSNANALRFEDAIGAEQVWLHAERNQDIEVELDETHWVGQDRKKTIDRDENTQVHRNRTEEVDGNETIAIHQNRTETVDQNETITIHQNRTETVDQDESITIHQNRSKTVDLNETDSIGKDWTTTVGQNKNETIKMAYMQNVGMGRMENVILGYALNVGMGYMINVVAEMSTTVGQSQSTTVGKSQSTTVSKGQTNDIGDDQQNTIGKNQQTTIGESQSTTITEDQTTSAKNITFTASESITLKVDKSVLVMKADGTITLNGHDFSVDLSGQHSVDATGNIVLKGAKILEN
jgi:type VI secretion system secreted protein VgrG